MSAQTRIGSLLAESDPKKINEMRFIKKLQLGLAIAEDSLELSLPQKHGKP
jgi:hypothetical protein